MAYFGTEHSADRSQESMWWELAKGIITMEENRSSKEKERKQQKGAPQTFRRCKCTQSSGTEQQLRAYSSQVGLIAAEARTGGQQTQSRCRSNEGTDV